MPAIHDFTLQPLDWRPYVTPLRLDDASPAQREAMAVTPSNTKVSAYVLTLALAPEMLAQRTPLFNDIMYAPGGLSRAGREMGALGASVVNRCIYCANVHARRHIQLDKRPEVIEAIFARGTDARLDAPLDQALFDFATDLTQEPASPGHLQFSRLREEGLDDGEIFDLINAVAIFGWANRLMHTLGEPVAAGEAG